MIIEAIRKMCPQNENFGQFLIYLVWNGEYRSENHDIKLKMFTYLKVAISLKIICLN